jgi:hypothetical protein
MVAAASPLPNSTASEGLGNILTGDAQTEYQHDMEGTHRSPYFPMVATLKSIDVQVVSKAL